MSEWSLYLDESGNTGTNMFDINQPFYVYAGWLIKKEDENSVTNYIRDSFKRVKAKEIKSKNILKRYRPELYDFLQNSINNRMLPFSYTFEKRHYVCCKIVETFFDYTHNSNAPIDLTFDFKKKREICNSIYKNEELLASFSPLISDSTITIEEMRQIKELLSDSMSSTETAAYKTMISNVTDEELRSMIDEFESVANGDGKIRQSPGGTELFSLIMQVNILMNCVGGTANIIVDELKDETFINDVRTIVDNHSAITNRIIDIKLEKSINNIMIQAADLLSGYINAMFRSDSNIIQEEGSHVVIHLLDTYNNELLSKYGVCPLNFASYYE